MDHIRSSIKQYIKDFIGNGIYDLIKFLLGLFMTTVVGTGLVYKILNLLFKNVFITIFISICMMFFLIIIFIIVYRHFRKYKFHITEMNVNFEYMEEKVIVTSKITVRALRKGIDKIYNRTTWFPDEKTKILCLEKEFSIERLPKRDTSNEYYVKFNKKLKKGETITFTTKVINGNKNKHFRDFYSREIITPMDKLSITVVIPSKYGYRYLTKETIKGSAYNDFSHKEKFEFINTYTWEIEPKLGYEYKLLWEKK